MQDVDYTIYMMWSSFSCIKLLCCVTVGLRLSFKSMVYSLCVTLFRVYTESRHDDWSIVDMCCYNFNGGATWSVLKESATAT